MKNILFTLTCLIVSSINAQLPFGDGFESYPINGYIGLNSARWTTFTGAKGGAEDAKISGVKFFTGSQSLYLSSSVEAGGPTDIVLPLSLIPINTGVFTFQWAMYVEGNKGAQINFHGSSALGSKYTLRMDFQQAASGNASLRIFDGKGDLGYFSYPVNLFFPIRLVGNLNNSKWDVYINNLFKGSIYANETDIYGVEFFPVNNSPNTTNNSGFYIDTLSATHAIFVKPTRNASLGSLQLGDGLAGKMITPKVRIRNVGNTAITSVTVGTNYAAVTKSQVISVSLASGEGSEISLNQMALAAGTNVFSAYIAGVNGTAGDDYAADDTAKLTTKAIAPAPNRIVVAEEATGTWCQWCPRGAVFMEYMEAKYAGNFVAIAVHNKDPMANKYYDSSFAFVISGYPSATIDRVSDIDPSNLEADFLVRIGILPAAKMELTGDYDAVKKELKVSVNTEFLKAVAGSSYKLAVVLTENGVTGTTFGYNQSNAYAGGKKGVMGGFELKGSPVPASEMTYQMVARTIVPAFGGKTNAYPASVTVGQKVVNDFIIPIDPTWNINNVMANALLIESTGKIDNGAKRKAMDLSKPWVSVKSINLIKDFNLYPNPSNGLTYLQVNHENLENTNIQIMDINGKIMFNETYQNISDKLFIPIITEHYTNGLYFVSVISGNEKITKKLIVE